MTWKKARNARMQAELLEGGDQPPESPNNQ